MSHGIFSYAWDYHVELIVFERELKQDAATEQWDFSSNRIAGNKLRIKELAKTVNFDPKPRDQLIYLNRVKRALVLSGYQILKSTQWQQPARFYHKAPLVSLNSQNNNLVTVYIRVYKTSLIFADIDIQLSPDSILANQSDLLEPSIDQIEKSQRPYYFISEKRRLKFKEIHYIDHPHFGAILGVWPVEEIDTE